MNEVFLNRLFLPHEHLTYIYPRHDTPLVNPPPLASWLTDTVSHMSKWLVVACYSCCPSRLIGSQPAGEWKETQDEPFVWVIGGIKTAHSRHRGYWWNGDSPDEELSFSFVPGPKLADRPFTVTRCPHGARSATEHESAQPEIGHVSLSALSPYELQICRCLWYPAVKRILNELLECDRNWHLN